MTTVLSVPFVALGMWLLTRHDISTGPPCEARGTFGCGLDENMAAAVGGFFGVLFAAMMTALHLLSARLPAVMRVLSILVFAGWLIMAAVLLEGTQFDP